mmetsp:Transcript_8398/g.14043  ORF Transcript_8398/g.14043 Transcript_8398/m.14043 type:complete len:111 (-) Transcript_8398:44-376(-)
MKLPAPKIAKEYYEEKTFMFDDFQSARDPGSRRPIIRNLYDVFFNIRNDEAEHFKTMIQAQDQIYIDKNRESIEKEVIEKYEVRVGINSVPNPYDKVEKDLSGQSGGSQN